MSKIDTKTIDSVTIATVLVEHIASDEDVNAISKEVKDLITSNDQRKVILNMENVEVMASLMVGELILLLKVFRKNSAILRMCCLSPSVMESLKITGICDLLPIDEDEVAGIQNINA